MRNNSKVVSVFLAIVILATCLFSMISVAESEFEDVVVWDGTADSTLEGMGTEVSPYLISNAGELRYAVTQTGGKYYKLTNDIIINDITVKIEDGVGVIYNADGFEKLSDDKLSKLNSWINQGTGTGVSRFIGTIDGDGHIIRGLYLDAVASGTAAGADYNYARALIPYAGTGTVLKNLGLEDAFISYEGGTASGFIGNNQGALLTAENCYVGASTYFYGHNASAFFGSGDQQNLESRVKNGYSQATLKLTEGASDTRFGAIYADSWYCGKATVENFYTTTKLAHPSIVRVANVYDNVTATEGYIGTVFDGNTFRPSKEFVATEGELPTLAVFRGITDGIWSGYGDSDIIGAGTEANPYLITSGDELAYVMSKNGDINSALSLEHFRLENDIYLNNVSEENWKQNDNNIWYSASDLDDFNSKKFVGNLDGNGYCVYGIWYPEDHSSYSSGLMIGAGAVTLKNIGIKESQIVSEYFAGGIVGYCSGSATTISGCFSDSTVDVIQNKSGYNGGAGGIIGYNMGGSFTNYLTIENCWSAANCISLQSQVRANGIIGTIWNGYHKVINCYSLGNAPYYADINNRVSFLAYDGAFVKYTDEAGNEISAIPEDHSAYNRVYVDYTDKYTWDEGASKYTSARTYTSYSKLDSAYINTYGSVSKAAAASPDGYKSYITISQNEMTGENALKNMSLNENVWYAVKNDGIAPIHRVYGTAIGDVDEDGDGATFSDMEELRNTLIGSENYLNTDYLRDGTTDICDLVAMNTARAVMDGTVCKHSYSSQIIEESTVTTNGTAKHTCTLCGYSFTEKLPTEIKILGIGNSFSVDGMAYLWNILNDAGVEKVTLGNLQIGGCSLDTHWTNISENNSVYSYGKNLSGSWSNATSTFINGLTDEDWDVITVQQVSQNSGMPSTYGNLPNILEYINENKTNDDAKIFWHMTWAYQQTSSHSGFANYNKDQMTMYNAIVSTVKEKVLTEELIDGVIPSGTTIQNMRTSYLGDTLTRDGFHMSYDYGRYAAGLTWMSAITGISADKVDWVPADYSYVANHKDMIDEAVKNAIEAPYAVTNSTYTMKPLSTDKNIMAEKGLDISDYKRVDWGATVGGYYLSTAGMNVTTGDATTFAGKYAYSSLFTKDTLPVGSVIILDDGYSYRPEGWINASTPNTGATRPATVTDTTTVVDEAWWGNFTIRAFNLNIISGAAMTEADTSALRIYIPIS